MAVYHRGVNPSPGLLTIQAVLFSFEFILSVETVLSLGKDWGQEGGYNIKVSEMMLYSSNETHTQQSQMVTVLTHIGQPVPSNGKPLTVTVQLELRKATESPVLLYFPILQFSLLVPCEGW